MTVDEKMKSGDIKQRCKWEVTKYISKKDGFKVSALTSPPTRLEPFSDAA